MLKWEADGTKFELLGATFGAKHDPIAQWFDRFIIRAKASGHWLDVLDVERAAAKGQQPSEGLHTVKIALDGQPLKLQHPTGTTDEPTGTHIFKGKHDVQLSIHTNSKIIGSELNERLKVRAGGAHFEDHCTA